jgi:hypothetical protein
MAYGLKYTIPFKDIDNYSNLVEIYQDGFVGSSTELIATEQPATHKYEREDNEDITTPIMSTTFTISFYSTDTTDFRNFFSYSDREFLVVHKFEGNVVFKGYLLNDITGEPFQDPPYPVVVTATDGLAQLKEVDLVGPSVDTELGSLIFETLNRLDLELDIEICNDLYEGLVMDNTRSIFDQVAGEQLLVQDFTFDELAINAYDFLLEICRSFGWILLQKNGRWLIQRPIARNIEGTMIYVHSYVDGSVIESFPNNTSTAITQWTNLTVDYSYKTVAYGNGIFVASFSAFRAYSYDGINWEESIPGGGWQIDSITFGNGLFVGVGFASVGSPGVDTAFVFTSTDGISWTSRTPAANLWWQGVVYGNGLFVAVARTGTGNRVMTSPNGINWTSRSTPMDADFTSVAFGNGVFVAVSVGGAGVTGGNVMTSNDGITWTQRNLSWNASTVFFANGKFTTGYRYSSDGITWNLANINFNAVGITYGNGYFVGLVDSGANRIYYSTDAITWTDTASPTLNTYRDITFGENTFVGVADTGANTIMFNYFEGFQSEIIGDQDTANTTWIPVGGDQLLQYQRPIKKLTVKQGGLGQSIITNGESLNESSWFQEGPYKLYDWTITPDPDSPIIQIFPNNIPSQTGYDDEQGVSWDIRFMANGEETDQPIISKPIFLDFAGLSLDLEVDINYSTLASGLGIALKHVDSNGTTRYLGTAIVGSLNVLAWSETYNTFVFNSTKDDDTRKFKLSSFVLPTAGFLSVELKFFGESGISVVTVAKIIPTFEGKRNPSEVTKIYETARAYTSLRDDTLRFSDLAITASKNWLKVGDLPAIVFVEKSLAATPGIIQVPSGAVTQVNRLTDTLGANTLNFSGGTVTGTYQRQFVADSGFTIDSSFVLISSLTGSPPPPSAELNAVVTTISSQQRNLTVTFNGYDYTGEANIQIQVFLKDGNGNNYQTSTFLLQVNANGTITYTQTNITFENQALLGGYSPRLRDCYARNVLTIYNALSYRLEGSFRRKGDTFGNGYIGSQLVYTGFSTVRLQVIGWEYDLASRVARITFGQVPTAYVYPIN